jgi:hypothetical protein
MVADRAGNSLRKARQINLSGGSASSSSSKSVIDWIGGADRNDFYKLNFTTHSSFTAQLDRLKANANLALLNQQGQVLLESSRRGKQAERIEQTLEPGTYFVRVYPGDRRARTRYRLTLAASSSSSSSPVPAPSTPLPNPNPAPGSPPGSNNRFDIQFDYRFDTSGWFTADRRAALEAAANVWEQIILDEFPDLPAGSQTRVVNPETGQLTSVAANAVDDVVIFVGAKSIGGLFSTLAQVEPGSWLAEQSRSDFAPWAGTITFNNRTNWFFDPTPESAADLPKNQIDFISIAAHEIGHILGISRSTAFENLTVNYNFQGANAKARNGGNPVRLTNTWHIYNNTQPNGSGDPLMSQFYTPGQRKLPTALDIAILDDTGYTVSYSTAARNPIS